MVIEIIYARKYLSNKTLTNVEEIVSNIKDTFIQVLNDTDWMDEESKERTLDKAQSISVIIGAPQNCFEDSIFEQIYPGEVSGAIQNY